MNELHAELERIVRSATWLADVLRVVRDVGPPGAHVGAGAIRNVVWDFVSGVSCATAVEDVDVVYFDPTPSSESWEDRLREALPGYRWDVTNQAMVHLWQREQSMSDVAPYPSLDAAVASWPETATAIAVRLCLHDSFSIVAPYGLNDLFELQLRPSPALKDRNVYMSRVLEKDWRSRWRKLTVHLPLAMEN